jgi:hypothetical protein
MLTTELLKVSLHVGRFFTVKIVENLKTRQLSRATCTNLKLVKTKRQQSSFSRYIRIWGGCFNISKCILYKSVHQNDT